MALHHDLIPYLKPAESAAWYLTNPLLVAAYPAGIARRVAELQAGKAEVNKLATDLATERARLRLKLCYGYEGDLTAQPDWQRIEELLQSTHIEARERMTVRAFARQCHATEWPWLIERMEKVITRRALAEGYEFAAA